MRRNDVAQDFIHSRSRLQGLGGGFVEFYEVLLVRHGNLRVVRHLLEEDGLDLVLSHLEMVLRRLKLLLVVRLIIGRNHINNALAAEEDLKCTLSRTCSDSHVRTLVLCLRVAADSEHLPGAGLEVELVVAKDLSELFVLEVLNHIVQLTFLVRLPKIVRDLQRNLGQDVGRLTFVVRQFVEQVLGLCEHEARKHSEGLRRKVGRDLVRLQLRDVFLQVLEDPGGLLHILASKLDLVALDIHVDGGASETHAIVVFGAQSVKK